MATTLYARVLTPALWGNSATRQFTVKDSGRAVTPGRLTFFGQNVIDGLSTTIGTTTGQAEQANTVNGPTAGEYLGVFGFFSSPIDADVTISGTVTFNFCGLESSMNANATFRGVVYRVDSQGALTLIIDSSFGTELGTTLARSTWTGTPTSTAMKKGDRIFLMPVIDDATAVTMATGFTVTFQHNGSNANTADSNVSFTETFGFQSTPPTGTSYWLRDTASDLGGIEKALSQTQGSGTSTLVHTTLAGPLTFPGDLWTVTAGGADVSFTTPSLDAFTLSGPVLVHLGHPASHALESTDTSPNDCFTVELSIVDAAGNNAVVWARSYTTHAESGESTHQVYLSGADLAGSQGSRIRLRVYSDDYLTASITAQVAGTDKTIRYDGVTTYASRIIFSQTLTEGAPPTPATKPNIITVQAAMRAAHY